MFDFCRLAAAFVRRDFLNLASYRLSLLLSSASALFYLAIFFFVSRIFSGVGAAYLARYGGEYFPFVVVGLALQTFVAAGLGGFSQIISQEQYLGTLEPILGRRASAFRVLAAASLARHLFSAARVGVYFVVAAVVFGAPFRPAGVPLFLLAAGLTVAAYFGLGMVSASFLLVFKQGNPIDLFFGQLGVVLAGVFFPVEVMPAWLRAVAAAVPLTYSLEISRAALLGGPAAAAPGRALLVLAFWAAATLTVGGLAFRWALRRAKRDGSLSQY